MNKKYFSIDEIQKKLEYYCSYQERCHSEVFNKIMKLTTNIGDANNIITKLIDDGYLNETRFCKEYSIGKFKHKNWGKNRIISELKKRKLGLMSQYEASIIFKKIINYIKKNNLEKNKNVYLIQMGSASGRDLEFFYKIYPELNYISTDVNDEILNFQKKKYNYQNFKFFKCYAEKSKSV